MTQGQKFGFPEKGEFSRDKLVEELTGKIVAVRGQGADFSVYGKLVFYEFGTLAVLNPYVISIGNKPVVVKQKAVVENPIVVSGFDYETIEELIEKYIKPTMESKKKAGSSQQQANPIPDKTSNS